MPAVVIPNRYGIVTLQWQLIPAGTTYTVTFGVHDYLFSSNPTQIATNYRNAMAAAGAPAEAASFYNTWKFLGANCLLRDGAGMLLFGQNLTAVTGTIAAPANGQPVYNPWVISKNTLFAGRAYRGRIYPPQVASDETGVDQLGNILPVTVASAQARWTAFFNTIVAYDPSFMCLLHTNPAIAPTNITSLLVRPVIGTQRRRRARGA